MQIDFPLHIGRLKRTATTDYEEHIRDLIEQLLFTNPGERVNRPDFGSGLMQLVFAGNGPQLASATQLMVQGALQKYLGELISVDAVDVQSEDAILRITVQYRIRPSEQQQIAQFERQF